LARPPTRWTSTSFTADPAPRAAAAALNAQIAAGRDRVGPNRTRTSAPACQTATPPHPGAAFQLRSRNRRRGRFADASPLRIVWAVAPGVSSQSRLFATASSRANRRDRGGGAFRRCAGRDRDGSGAYALALGLRRCSRCGSGWAVVAFPAWRPLPQWAWLAQVKVRRWGCGSRPGLLGGCPPGHAEAGRVVALAGVCSVMRGEARWRMRRLGCRA